MCVVQRAAGDGAVSESTGATAGAGGAIDDARGRQAAMGQPAPHMAQAVDATLVNHNRIERLLREKRLLVGQRRRRKQAASSRALSQFRRRRTSGGAWTSFETRDARDGRFACGRWSMMRRAGARC